MSILTTVPTSGIGKPNDVIGMIAVNSTHFYYTNANYNGSTVIWFKVAKSTSNPVPIPTPPTRPAPPPAAPKVPSISVTSIVNASGASITVNWFTSNATSLTLDGISVPVKGSKMYSQYGTRRLEFIATGPMGTTTKSTTITLAREIND